MFAELHDMALLPKGSPDRLPRAVGSYGDVPLVVELFVGRINAATIACYPRVAGAKHPANAGYAILCERVWIEIRQQIDRERARCSADLGLALPIPLSQVLVWLPAQAAGVRPVDPELCARLANTALEIVESFPDEHQRVRVSLFAMRAHLLLIGGHEDAHFLFRRLMNDHPAAWAPVREYGRAMFTLRMAGRSRDRVAMLERKAQAIETFLVHADRELDEQDVLDAESELDRTLESLEYVRSDDS